MIYITRLYGIGTTTTQIGLNFYMKKKFTRYVKAGMDAGTTVAEEVQRLAEGWLYTALWPGTRLLRHRLYPPPRPNEITFTFDDGPNAEFTPRVLDVLATRKVKAVFFLVGKFAKVQPSLVRRIVDEGHLIGNHTWNHPNLEKVSGSQVIRELDSTKTLLEDISGETVRVFRPPYGAFTPDVLNATRDLGMLLVLWNAMTVDWEERPPTKIVQELTRQIERNQSRRRASYLVLHDGRADNPHANCSQSIEAVAELIDKLQDRYRFVSIQI